MNKPKRFQMSNASGYGIFVYDDREMDNYIEWLESQHATEVMKAELRGIMNERVRAEDAEIERLWGKGGLPEPMTGRW